MLCAQCRACRPTAFSGTRAVPYSDLWPPSHAAWQATAARYTLCGPIWLPTRMPSHYAQMHRAKCAKCLYCTVLKAFVPHVL